MKEKEPSNLTREEVAWAYRLFLGREPESEEVIHQKLRQFDSIEDLRQSFIYCQEFIQSHYNDGNGAMHGHEPAMNIETHLSEGDLNRLLRHIQNTWEHLGNTEPHWSVITSPEFKQSQIEQSSERFFRLGEADVQRLVSTLQRNGIDLESIRSCLEYGCGIGRVTPWLAKRFPQVFAADLSEPHLQLADKLLSESKIDNVSLMQIQRIDDLDQLPKVDLIYSVIVLQHNPPPLIKLIIGKFLEALKPSGVAYFQVPTYEQNYRFNLQDYLSRKTNRKEMEMHVLPQHTIFDAISNGGCQVLEVLEDSWAGNVSERLSNTFVARKT